jgi:hypothetical protein
VHKFQRELENEIRFGLETCDGLTRSEAIQRIAEDMGTGESTLSQAARFELQRYLAGIGVFKAYTDEQLAHIVTMGGHGRKYDFRMDGQKYRFETWKPLEKEN